MYESVMVWSVNSVVSLRLWMYWDALPVMFCVMVVSVFPVLFMVMLPMRWLLGVGVSTVDGSWSSAV